MAEEVEGSNIAIGCNNPLALVEEDSKGAITYNLDLVILGKEIG